MSSPDEHRPTAIPVSNTLPALRIRSAAEGPAEADGLQIASLHEPEHNPSHKFIAQSDPQDPLRFAGGDDVKAHEITAQLFDQIDDNPHALTGSPHLNEDLRIVSMGARTGHHRFKSHGILPLSVACSGPFREPADTFSPLHTEISMISDYSP